MDPTPPFLQQFINTLWTFDQSKANEELLQTGLFADILARLSRAYVGAQWRALSYLWDKYETGLKLSREGKLKGAEQVFAEADEACHQLNSDPAFGQLVQVAALPAIAYLRYKEARYREAESLLIASIDSDAQLLSEGFYILEYHRVQQLHNLARLYFRQNRLDDGAQMIAEALQFIIYGHKPSVGNGNGWQEQNTAQIPAQLSSDMLFQLTNETAGLFLAYPDRNRQLCQIAFRNLAFANARTDDEDILQQWFWLKEIYAKDQFNRFLQESLVFLVMQPNRFDACKLSILMDIAEGINQRGAYTIAINEAIQHFISKLQISKKQHETCSIFFRQLTDS